MIQENVLGWRGTKFVLVTGANALGSIAVIRSLGRAGYRVAASSELPCALGLRSNYCERMLIEPSAPEQFFLWLDEVIVQHKLQLIIPTEAFLLKLRPNIIQYKHLLPVPKDENMIYAGLSKFDLFRACKDNGLIDHLPPFILIDATDELPELVEFDTFVWPVFLKLDSSYSLNGEGSKVVKCNDYSDLTIEFYRYRACYRKILIQGYVEGVGVGAFLARWSEQELASFMHRRLHEDPHTGGASSYRCGFRSPVILNDARRCMEALGWNGVGMFEYRWNPITGDYYLLEFNSRFWGSLHLALFSNVDFPAILVDAFFGRPTEKPSELPGVRARITFPGEIGYLRSYTRDSTVPLKRKIKALFEFLFLGLNPNIKADLWFPGDRKLYFIAAYRTLRGFFGK